MAKSRHSVVCLQMLHRPQRRVTSRRGCRLVALQPHMEAQRDQIQLLHPWIVARKQSRGWQNRQASRIAAQRSREESMKLLLSVKRAAQDCKRLWNVPTSAVRRHLPGWGQQRSRLGLRLICHHGRWTTDRCCPHRSVALVRSSRNFCS